jgi:serine/threonine protein kinase
MARRFEIDGLIGEYRVTRFLGEGGMGVVYLGVHEKLGRPAAIKILGAAATDESFRSRFFNEARLQANLHHPHIATLYDFQQQGDELLIFMEYVDGEGLDELVARRAFSVEDALVVFRSICEAVGYMHANGIVDRDIKAQNVKLTAAGAVKLLDFGIAKVETSHGLTQTGGIVGTPTYLSPEQLRGGKASPQTDIWALGVLLYEMLTGKLPFEGESLGGLVLKITSEPFEQPDRVNPAVPRDVAKVVSKCLDKDPADRYRSIGELVSALDAAIARRGVSDDTIAVTIKRTLGIARASHTPVYEEFSSSSSGDQEAASLRPSSKRPAWGIFAAVGAAAILLLVVVIGVGVWMIGGGDVIAANAGANSRTNSRSTANGPMQKVRVDVDEGKAQVIRDGQIVGMTPVDIDIASGDRPNLTLRRDGFEDKTVQIEPNAGKKTLTFSLKPKN